ncbi:MAG: hypothetical protein ACXWFY_03785 [Chthoniobacterales bacterium]
MPEDEERDFILLCEAILEDGEVSAEEAYGIAEWLNDHPETARTWPANELIQPLQEIWADGTVNRSELQRLARLLVRLTREGRLAAQERKSPVPKIAVPTFSSGLTSGARLPNVDATIQVPSWRELGVVFAVNLTGPKCSCPEWRGRRSHLPFGHLTRCCKHVFAAYAQLQRAPQADDWLLAYIDYGWPAHPRTDWDLLTVEREKVLISNAANKGWANVFAKEDEEYKRFGYNLEEHRWAYGSEPRWSWVITDAIRSLEEGSKIKGANRPNAGRAGKVAARTESRTANPVWFLAAAATVVALIALSSLWKQKALWQGAAASHHETWAARTIREVRVMQNNQEIIIPSGAQLRVIGRAGNDVFVSYNGISVTIPNAATDLK